MDINIWYLFDYQNQINTNKNGRNYWYCYITELFNKLGIHGEILSPENINEISDNDILFLGNDELTNDVKDVLAKKSELTVIGLGTRNADEIFGIKSVSMQEGKEFTINSWFRMTNSEYLPVENYDYKLPIISDINVIESDNSETLALIDDTGTAGLTKRDNKYYFTFDICQTIWTCSAGKPLYNGGMNGFNIGRVPDSRIVPLDYDTKIAFGDYYVYIVQTILSKYNIPMLHRLPPCDDGKIPDWLLFIGGDDDATSGEMNLKASEILYNYDLPYHINVMPRSDGTFVSSYDDYKVIKSRGHEIALHYDFVSGGFEKVTADDFRDQQEIFFREFGEISICNVGHCVASYGWAERCRDQAELGVMGDNSRMGEIDANDINAFNMQGFAFGTAFPFFAYDDYTHYNKKLKFIEIPNTYYEPRLKTDADLDLLKIHNCIDQAVKHGRCINYFLHPHYVSGWYGGGNEPVLNAIEETLRYCEKNNYVSNKTTGVNQLCLWWHDRAECKIFNIKNNTDSVDFNITAMCDMIVKIPDNNYKELCINGKTRDNYELKNIDGIDWFMFTVKKGLYTIKIEK
jgi:hypothetical protein